MSAFQVPTLLTLAMLTIVGCQSKTNTDTMDTTTSDSDSDVANADQPDADGDTIIDVVEGTDDADGDGKANMDDKDADGDGIRDIVEAGDQDPMTLPVDSDSDGVPDYLDTDSDNNCVGDADEAGRSDGGAVDSDGDGVKDYADPDNDNDGILDVDEIGDQAKCDPPDTDGDGTPDYMDLDSDGDGIGDSFEGGTTDFDHHAKDSDGDGIPDYQDTDSDNDGFSDQQESGVSSVDQEPADTDGDGLYDFQDDDSDGDGLTDNDEANVYGTDPYDFDSDGDGYSDGGEVLADTDPLDPDSVIDGVYVEVGERTEVEQDFTFALRIEQGDVALISDTTCSMSGTITAVKSVYTTVLNDLTSTFPDVAGGVAYHDDYGCCGYGSPGIDSPFGLDQQMTTDFTLVQNGVNKLTIHSGDDGPEGSIESLYQGATGAGYDLDCDGVYDSATDIRPFLSDPSDPFGGTSVEWYDASVPDSGTRGGFGFRTYSLPIIALATDAYMRDPEATNPSYNGTPGGCPMDAGSTDVVNALANLGGYFIGLDVSGVPMPQMIDLAQRTNSAADMDGDGTIDTTNTNCGSPSTGSKTCDLLVYYLDQSKPTYADDFANYVVTAVDQLVQSIKFTEVTLEVEGDEYGFVTAITPTKYTDIDPDTASDLVFTLTFRGTVAATKEDQIFLLTLNIIGDGTTLVGSKDIVVVVPGTSY